MFGVLVNTAAVIAGGIFGLIFRKGIPESFSTSIMNGLGLCTLFIGISGTLKGNNVLVLVCSIVIGSIIGTALQIEKRLNSAAEKIGSRFSTGSASFSQGFVTGSLLFCAGAMAIMGSLSAGLSGDNEILFTKSVLDLTAAALLTVSLGAGVIFSAFSILLYEGAIALAAQFLQPFLTEAAVAEITSAGSLIIIALGLNILGITKIKVADYLPAVLIAPVLVYVIGLF